MKADRDHALYSISLVMEYEKYWVELGLKGFLGNYGRNQNYHGGWWWNRPLKACKGMHPQDCAYYLGVNMEAFKTAIEAAKSEKDYPQKVWDLLTKIHMFGGMACLFFYPFIVLTGIVENESAMKFATMTPINMNSNYAKKLATMGCTSESKLREVIKRVARKVDCSPATVENILCEEFRKSKKMDIKFPDQNMYDITKSGSGGEEKYSIQETLFHVAV